MSKTYIPDSAVLESLVEELPPTLIKMDSANNYAKMIQVRIEFLGLGEVDTFNEKFQAEVRIRSRWYDDEEIEEYDRNRHWNPKLFIENAMHDVKEEINYVVSRFDNKTIVTEIRHAKGSFWERIELQNFPIDIQELSVTIASKLKPSMVKLVADNEKISNIHNECLHTFRDQQKWVLYKMVRVSETASYDMDSSRDLSYKSNSVTDFHEVRPAKKTRKSKFVATCYCSRRPGYYLTNCYSFNFLITILSLTLFAIEARLAQNRISGTFTLILTSVSFKFVTNRTLPTVSYMTSLDRYQIVCIIYLVMCCVWHATISSLDLTPERKFVVDKIVLGVFATVFASIQIFFAINIVIAYQKIKEFLSQPEAEESDDEEY